MKTTTNILPAVRNAGSLTKVNQKSNGISRAQMRKMKDTLAIVMTAIFSITSAITFLAATLMIMYVMKVHLMMIILITMTLGSCELVGVAFCFEYIKSRIVKKTKSYNSSNT